MDERAGATTGTVNTRHVTTAEAARRLGISRTTLLRAVRRGEVQPALRTPGGALRFNLDDLDTYAHRLAPGSHHPAQAPARWPGHIPAGGSPSVVDRAVALFALDPAGIITMCHGAGLAALGLSPEAAIGRSIFEFYHDDPHSLDQMRRALAGDAVTFASHVRGSAIEHRLVPQRDGAGKVTGLVGVATDVTVLTSAEEALRTREEVLWRSEARYRALLESASDAIVAVDQDGRIVLTNAEAERLFGYPRQALLGRPIETLLPEPVRTAHVRRRAHYQAAPHPRPMGSGLELYARRHDGSALPVEISLSPLTDGGQQLVTAVIRDSSARKTMEGELRASEARFRALTEHSSDITRVLDADGTIRYASASHWTVLGYEPAAVLGRTSFDFMHPDDVGRARAVLAALVAQGGRRHLVTRTRHADGTYHTFETILDNRLDDPAVRGIVVNARDATERQQAEEARGRLAAIVAGSSDAIIGMGLDRTITSWNAGCERLYGYTAEEAIGCPIDLLAVPDGPNEVSQIRDVLLSGEAVMNLDTERRHRDGRVLVVSISVSPVRDASGAVIGAAAIHRDITVRKAAERAVEEALALAEAMDRVSFALAGTLEPDHLYRIILEQAMEVLPCDNAAIFLYRDGWAWAAATRGEPAVPAGTRLFPISGPDPLWLATDHPGAVYLPDADLEPTWVHPAPWVGERRTRSVIGVPLRIEGEAVGMFQIHSFTSQRYGARHLALAEAFGSRIVQALRNAHLYVEERQRARAAEDLAQLRSDLLGEVSHELRTPLTAVIGFAELLRKRWLEMDEERRESCLEGIARAAHRQLRLVQDLLDTSRIEAEGFRCECRPFALRPVLERATADVRDSYPGQLVDLDGPDEVAVEGDAERTQQILVNLIDNAAKYSPEGSPVAVSWGLEDGQMVVRVRDRGLGIPEGGQAKLFTRFGRLEGSTTRAGRSSTGLGLYLSRTLARAMGGELDLESTGPRGSVFRLVLPGAPQP